MGCGLWQHHCIPYWHIAQDIFVCRDMVRDGIVMEGVVL